MGKIHVPLISGKDFQPHERMLNPYHFLVIVNDIQLSTLKGRYNSQESKITFPDEVAAASDVTDSGECLTFIHFKSGSDRGISG
jgi:hypothetical protein